jgi:hypothetical protein
MKKLIALCIIAVVLLPLPVRAGVLKEFDPIEQDLVNKKFQDEMNKEFKKSGVEPISGEKGQEVKQGSNWWKWTLGAVLVGGVVAVAAGGKNGGSSGGNTGDGTVHW